MDQQGNQQGNDTDGNEQHWLKELRRKAEAYDREFPALQREVALTKAGIDMSNPVAELFAKAYDGELTPDAVKEAASKYGLVAGAEQQAPQQVQQQPAAPSPEELAFQRIAQAGQAAEMPTVHSSDWMNAKSMDEALRLYKAAGGLVNDTVD